MKDMRWNAVFERVREGKMTSVIGVAAIMSASVPPFSRDLKRLCISESLCLAHGGAAAHGLNSASGTDREPHFGGQQSPHESCRQAHEGRWLPPIRRQNRGDGNCSRLSESSITAVTSGINVCASLRHGRRCFILLPADHDSHYDAPSDPNDHQVFWILPVNHGRYLNNAPKNVNFGGPSTTCAPIKQANRTAAERRTVTSDASQLPDRGAERLPLTRSIRLVIKKNHLPNVTTQAYASTDTEMVIA